MKGWWSLPRDEVRIKEARGYNLPPRLSLAWLSFYLFTLCHGALYVCCVGIWYGCVCIYRPLFLYSVCHACACVSTCLPHFPSLPLLRLFLFPPPSPVPPSSSSFLFLLFFLPPLPSSSFPSLLPSFLSLLPLTLADWNTWSDEGSLPQLRQTSCAALACCLHHSGLLTYAMTCK